MHNDIKQAKQIPQTRTPLERHTHRLAVFFTVLTCFLILPLFCIKWLYRFYFKLCSPTLQSVLIHEDFSFAERIAKDCPKDDARKLKENIMLAAKKGCTQVVNRLIEKSASPNTSEYCNIMGTQTVLTQALSNDHTDTLKLLLDKRANPNIGVIDGNKALMYALRHNKMHAARMLIDAQADLNVRDYVYGTPLSFAVRNGLTDTARMLIDAKANLNVGGIHDHGATLLTNAAYRAHQDIVKLLISAKANIFSAFQLFIMSARQKEGSRRGNPLNAATCLIEAKADLDVQGSHGNTPLMFAAKQHCLGFVKMLLDRGANPNAVNTYGDTVLTCLARCDSVADGAKMLIEAKANLHVMNNAGDTPLILAIRHHHFRYAKLLIKHGAVLDESKRDGRTPLITAAYMNDARAVQSCINQKVALDVKDKSGVTALIAAAQMDHSQVVKQLIDAKADTFFAYTWAIDRHNCTVLRSLLWQQKDVETLVKRRSRRDITTPLFRALETDNDCMLPIISRLLSHSKKKACGEPLSRCIPVVAVLKKMVNTSASVFSDPGMIYREKFKGQIKEKNGLLVNEMYDLGRIYRDPNFTVWDTPRASVLQTVKLCLPQMHHARLSKVLRVKVYVAHVKRLYRACIEKLVFPKHFPWIKDIDKIVYDYIGDGVEDLCSVDLKRLVNISIRKSPAFLPSLADQKINQWAEGRVHTEASRYETDDGSRVDCVSGYVRFNVSWMS